MSRNSLGDFDVITGPPAPLRRTPAATLPQPLPDKAEPSAPQPADRPAGSRHNTVVKSGAYNLPLP